jgi:hypothetical protein
MEALIELFGQAKCHIETAASQEGVVCGPPSRFEPRIGADRFQLLCTVCDLPRATTGPLAAKKSADATNMWGSASVALGQIVSATPRRA